MEKQKTGTLFENEHFVALNKPSGLLSVPDREGKEISLKQILKEKYGQIWTVHRLDKDTSGVIVFAKDEETHKYLSGLFEGREVEKFYTGIVHGVPAQGSGSIDAPIMEHPVKKGLMVIDPDEYKEILSHSSSIRRWSAAPELEGAIEFGKYIKAKGILPAIAHTDAIYEEALEAFNNGFTLATHLYSAMSGVTRRNAYRYAGVIETAFIIDEMDVEIIADGVHLPAPLLKLIYKIKGADRTVLITDAMRAAGMPEGDSILGNIHDGIKVIVEDGVAKLPDRSSFAGSVATADRLVRTMIHMAEVPLHEAITMIDHYPD